jgi:hypothetical protein
MAAHMAWNWAMSVAEQVLDPLQLPPGPVQLIPLEHVLPEITQPPFGSQHPVQPARLHTGPPVPESTPSVLPSGCAPRLASRPSPPLDPPVPLEPPPPLSTGVYATSALAGTWMPLHVPSTQVVASAAQSVLRQVRVRYMSSSSTWLVGTVVCASLLTTGLPPSKPVMVTRTF